MSHAIKYDFVYHLYFSDGTPIFTSWQKSISNFFIHVLFCFQPFVLNRKPIFSINMVLHSLEFQIQWKIFPFLESPPLTFPIVSSQESKEYFIIFLFRTHFRRGLSLSWSGRCRWESIYLKWKIVFFLS